MISESWFAIDSDDSPLRNREITTVMVGALVPAAERMALPVKDFPEVVRWYKGLAALPGWREALATTDSAMAAWRSKRAA